MQHLLRRNTRAGSRKNISAHYDLGNAFYKLWLDPSMNYSSAWFEGGDRAGDLRAAQDAKMRRALQEPASSPANACWRWAVAGAPWPRWRRATLAPRSRA